ncbi:MAG: hypothetical protein J4400_03140 [Candidatus Aenigmarchaeota archaeon]|nr:hypothetical protein [Candidatus Aenigmarchaeota archaeon]
MAKPIGATPTLSGKDAELFVKDLVSPAYTETQKKLFEDLKVVEAIVKSKKE